MSRNDVNIKNFQFGQVKGTPCFDSSNLTSTFEKIVDSIPFGFAIHFALPFIYLDYDEKKELAELANAVRKHSGLRMRAIRVDNIHFMLLQKVPYPPQIGRQLEVGPDTA